MVAGIAAALEVGALFADVVAIEARKAAQSEQKDEPALHLSARTRVAGLPDNVVSFKGRKPRVLPADTRPLPSVTAYDQLLRRTSPPQTGESR